MHAEISKQTQHELLETLPERYAHSSRSEKTKILDQFVAIARCHRKHAIRLLIGAHPRALESSAPARRIYSEATREALIILGRPPIASAANGSKRSCPA
ncbi:MAG TPA: hypothetical protein VKY56_09415 [Chloroflexota bacterium]|nr:hypothetical protein [Chloroflexota bacterium]